MQWEQKIEDLESQLRKTERVRIQSQLSLENFHSTLQLKMNLLTDPHDDIAAPAKEYFTQTRDKLNQDVRQRAEQRAELKKRLDELRRAKQCGESREALIDAYRKSEAEQDKVNKDLERQMNDLTDRIKQCKEQMDERQKALESQIDQL